MKPQLLVIYNGNYADEIDVTASVVVEEWITEEEFHTIPNPDVEQEIYFGSNQYLLLTPREIYTGVDLIKLNTEAEVNLANRLSGTFTGVIDRLYEAVGEAKDEAIKVEDAKRWQKIIDTPVESEYVDMYYEYQNLDYSTYKSYTVPDNDPKKIYSRNLQKEIKEFWFEMGMKYPVAMSPENLLDLIGEG